MKAAIVGGGIGGLAAAAALRRVGIETVVFERAWRLETVGAGLTLSPNAVRALDRLGVGDAVRAVSGRGRQLLVRAPTGRTLLKVEVDDPLEMLGVHRADLQRILAEAAGDVRLGTEVTDVESVAADADVVVGADGIDSVVRASRSGPASVRRLRRVACSDRVRRRASARPLQRDVGMRQPLRADPARRWTRVLVRLGERRDE